MRRMDASQPENPIETASAARAQDSTREITNEWFGQMDVYSRLRDVYDVANRNNTAVYSLDRAVSRCSSTDSTISPDRRRALPRTAARCR
jgi:hypothetical protein